MAILASNQYTIIDYTDVYIDVSPESILIPVDTNNIPINQGSSSIVVKFKNGGGEVLPHNINDNVTANNFVFDYSSNQNQWNGSYSWSNNTINAQDIIINGSYKNYNSTSIVHVMPVTQGEDGDTINDVKELYYLDLNGLNVLPQNLLPNNNNVGDEANKIWHFSPSGTWQDGAVYWTCNQIIYESNRITYTAPIRAENFNVSYEARAEAASKIRTYYGTTNERENKPAIDLHDGDLWYDSDNNNKIYRWTKGINNIYSWQEVSDSRLDNLIDDSDGEVTIYYSETDPDDPNDPDDIEQNDLWCHFPKGIAADVWHRQENSNNVYKKVKGGTWAIINTENTINALNTLLNQLSNLVINSGGNTDPTPGGEDIPSQDTTEYLKEQTINISSSPYSLTLYSREGNNYAKFKLYSGNSATITCPNNAVITLNTTEVWVYTIDCLLNNGTQGNVFTIDGTGTQIEVSYTSVAPSSGETPSEDTTNYFETKNNFSVNNNDTITLYARENTASEELYYPTFELVSGQITVSNTASSIILSNAGDKKTNSGFVMQTGTTGNEYSFSGTGVININYLNSSNLSEYDTVTEENNTTTYIIASGGTTPTGDDTELGYDDIIFNLDYSNLNTIEPITRLNSKETLFRKIENPYPIGFLVCNVAVNSNISGGVVVRNYIFKTDELKNTNLEDINTNNITTICKLIDDDQVITNSSNNFVLCDTVNVFSFYGQQGPSYYGVTMEYQENTATNYYYDEIIQFPELNNSCTFEITSSDRTWVIIKGTTTATINISFSNKNNNSITPRMMINRYNSYTIQNNTNTKSNFIAGVSNITIDYDPNYSLYCFEFITTPESTPTVVVTINRTE